MSPEPECKLICVPPDAVAQIWPKISGLIYVAMKKGNFSAFAPVKDAVLNGNALLWLVWDGVSPNAEAAVVTQLNETEWRRVCTIVACGGMRMKRWIGLIKPIEDFAKSCGCSAVRIIGRDGWSRVLTDYRPKRLVMEKEL